MSVLRTRDDGGPRVLRSRDGPERWGLKGLKPWEEQHVWTDGQLWPRTLLVAKLAHQGSPEMLALLTQPEDPAVPMGKPETPTFTSWPELMEVLEGHLALQRVGLDQGALGHDRRKPTALWTNMAEVTAMNGFRDRPSTPPWPQDLSEAVELGAWNPGLKRAIIASISNAMDQLGAAVRMLQLHEWYQHLAQDHFPYRRDCYE